MTLADRLQRMEEEFDQKFTPNSIYPEEVKSFFKAQIKDIVEEVVGELPKKLEMTSDWREGYNKAIDNMQIKLQSILKV